MQRRRRSVLFHTTLLMTQSDTVTMDCIVPHHPAHDAERHGHDGLLRAVLFHTTLLMTQSDTVTMDCCVLQPPLSTYVPWHNCPATVCHLIGHCGHPIVAGDAPQPRRVQVAVRRASAAAL